jgi:hypothetical protein
MEAHGGDRAGTSAAARVSGEEGARDGLHVTLGALGRCMDGSQRVSG